MLNASEVADRLNRLEQTLEQYFRRDPVAESNRLSAQAAGEFNTWVSSGQAGLHRAQAELETGLAAVRDLEREIGEADRILSGGRPDPREAAAVEAYNQRVRARNDKARQHGEAADEHRRRADDLGIRVAEWNAEAARRRQAVEHAQTGATEIFESYRAWMGGNGERRFWYELNSLFAAVCAEARRHAAPAGELKAWLGHLRALRAELARWARARQETAENGLLIVPAILGAGEECALTVDTGATVVSVAPELVEALGWSDRMGAEVELTLPNGLTTRGPSLVLPRLSVQGVELTEVEAVVLSETGAGVDGLLGMSFLSRLYFEVIRDRPQRLVLRPREEAEPRYDVFLCHKSEDEWWAHVVYDALRGMGLRPFFSPVSLPDSGEAEFRKPIDAALEEARHMVVVGSSRPNFCAPWVESEWGLWVSRKRAGKIGGNLVTVLCGGMPAGELPAALSVFQAVDIADLRWRRTLASYLPRRA